MTVETYTPNADFAPVTLTEAAVKHARLQIARQYEHSQGVRLTVKKSGCSGYRYELDYVAEPGVDDLCFESHGLPLFVASELMPLVSGTQIDMVQQGLNKVVHYSNPHAEGVCGCGESFAVASQAP